ncbi:MAG: hypothetical protein H0X72_20835 [Acidobacteria bacterium]|nr:hypothetical protein [Acidobacteriota bacterium]
MSRETRRTLQSLLNGKHISGERTRNKSRIAEAAWREIEARIREQWSPEQISGSFSLEGKSVSQPRMDLSQTLWQI